MLQSSQSQSHVLLLIVLSLLVSACSQQSPPPPIIRVQGVNVYEPPTDPLQARKELMLRENVIRELLTRRHPSGETCFIAFGHNEKGNWINPPKSFIQRLADLKLDIRPVSRARLPRDGEMISKRRYRGVETMNTGKSASVYYVHITRWIDETHVELNHGRYSGPLSGGGVFSAIYEYKNDDWHLKSEGQGWIG